MAICKGKKLGVMAKVLYMDSAYDGMSVAEFKTWFLSLDEGDLLKVCNEGLRYNRFGVMLLNTEDNLRGAIHNFWGDDVLNILQHFQFEPSDFDSQFIFLDPYCENVDCYNRTDLEEFICDWFGSWERFADDALHIELNEEDITVNEW